VVIEMLAFETLWKANRYIALWAAATADATGWVCRGHSS